MWDNIIMWDSSSSSEDEDRVREHWVRPYYQQREKDGAFEIIFKRLRSDPDLFHYYMRMDAGKFETLLGMVAPIISKQWTIRQPISAQCCLAIALRYLATGESQRSLSLSYKCSPSVVHNIIRDTCRAIVNILKLIVFPKQNTMTYLEVAQGFNAKCQFPHCCGAIDGKHVQIEAPAKSGSTFFSYKKTYSIVLLGICDANYRFMAAEVGAAGRKSDNGVFNRSEFGNLYFSKKVPLPEPSDINKTFVARRGNPREWWSDNGTNLKGADRELREAFDLMNKYEIVKTFTTSEMTWNFIPASSSHMGGAWERLVRSVKTSLASILLRHRLTDELLRAAFIEVENIVNSRPLTYIPIENGEEESLTPNQFIHGNSNGMKPLVPPDEDGVSLRRGWKVAQQIADSFLTRWIREYLPNITRRSKWFQKTKPIEIGDIVYIADPNSPRNCWPKGRVVSLKMGADGQVRRAFVRIVTGEYERPANKIAVLSVNKEVGPHKDIPGGSVKKIRQP